MNLADKITREMISSKVQQEIMRKATAINNYQAKIYRNVSDPDLRNKLDWAFSEFLIEYTKL